MTRDFQPLPTRAADRKTARAATATLAAVALLHSVALAGAAGEMRFSDEMRTALAPDALTEVRGGEIQNGFSLQQQMIRLAMASDGMLLFDAPRLTAPSPAPQPKPEALRSARLAAPSALKDVIRSAKKPRAMLLGSLGRSVSLTPVTSRWNRIVASQAGGARLSACANDASRCDTETYRTWHDLLGDARRDATLHQKLTRVNGTVNRMIAYRADSNVWKRSEYWATPTETLDRRAGDCEDFAIVKYWTLRELGVAERDMRVVALRDTAKRFYHAVLAVNVDGEWLILDNRFSKVRNQKDLPQYKPLYSISEAGQWAHLRQAPGKPVVLADRMKVSGL